MTAEGVVIRPRSNIAGRCLAFVRRVRELGDLNVDAVFRHALGLEAIGNNDPDQRDMVRAVISSLRRQQRQLTEMLAGLPPDLCASIVNVNSELEAMTYLEHPIRNFGSFCSSEYQLALGWASYYLAESGESADIQQVSEVLNEVVSLKASLARLQFPIDVREFIEQLLQELERGIVTANFEGKGSLMRACRSATTEIASAAEQLRSAEPVLNDDQRKYLNEAADKVKKVMTIASGEKAAFEYARSLAPLLLQNER